MIRISITDDSPIVISGVIDLIKDEDDMQVVCTFKSVADLRGSYKTGDADIMLLDINLGDASGLDQLDYLKQSDPALAIIMLTSYDNVAFVKQGMKNGAMGYLPKSITKTALNDAVRVVAGGDTYIHPKIQQILLQDAIGHSSNKAFIPELTRREKQILKLISEELTTAEISQELNISVKTVETHRAHLFQKLQVKNIAGLIRVAIRSGLL